MENLENTGVVAHEESYNGDENAKDEKYEGTNQGEAGEVSKMPQDNENGNRRSDPHDASTGKKKRSHKKYIPSIDRTALQELEGTTTSSFVDLARMVILIDGVPYDENILPMSKARKIDFERLIAHHAKLEIYGSRKYHIKSVVNRKTKEMDNDVELRIKRKEAYVKPKPLTEAQKASRRAIYKVKKELAKREALRHAESEQQKAAKKIAEMQANT